MHLIPTNKSGIRRAYIVPFIFLAVYALQCLWFIRTQSFTFDEPVHIAEGLDAWRAHRFERYNDHPPLARLLCAIPLISSKWQVEVQPVPDGYRITRITPDPEAMAWRARSMNVLLGLLLAALVWFVAHRYFGVGAANFASGLFVFSPSLIAHFSMATTDGAPTLLIFASAWLAASATEHQGWLRTFVVGVTLGLLLLAKYSTLPMFVLALFWVCANRHGILLNPLRWNWRRGATVFALALFVVWAGYFFHISHLTVHDGQLTATFPNWTAPIQKPVHSFNYSLWVPAGEYIEGFRMVARHNLHGQNSIFLGQISRRGGWKLYYPVAVLLKWPTTVLCVITVGVVLIAFRKLKFPSTLWIMLSFPALYFGIAIFSRLNIGERHILPVYPFALMIAAAVWSIANSRTAKLVLSVLVVVNAADALRFAPDYLSYFTRAVSPRNAYTLLSDSNLDWGQGLLALRKYEVEHPREQIWLAYFGSVDPRIYGLRAQNLAEGQRVSGTVVISATHLSGQYLEDPNSYRWALQQTPLGMLDHCLFVFQAPPP